MSKLATLRQRINRDDGRWYRAGNRDLGFMESTGLLMIGVSPLAWFVLPKAGVSAGLAGIPGLAGASLLAFQFWRSRKRAGDQQRVQADSTSGRDSTQSRGHS